MRARKIVCLVLVLLSADARWLERATWLLGGGEAGTAAPLRIGALRSAEST